MRRVRLVACIVASALAAPTPGARLVVVGATVLSASGCSKCTLQITTPSPLPDGRVGQAYSVQLQADASADCGTLTWEMWAGGLLPPGLNLSQGGALSGIPTFALPDGLGYVVATVVYASGSDEYVRREYALRILP